MRNIHDFAFVAGKINPRILVWGAAAAVAGMALSVGIKELTDYAMRKNANKGSKEPNDFEEELFGYTDQPEEGMVNFILGTGDCSIKDEDNLKKQREWYEMMFSQQSTPMDEMRTVVQMRSMEAQCHE